MQRGADCVEAAGGRRVIAKANTPSKSPSGVRHGLCPWWTTLSEFIIFSIQYSVFSAGEESPQRNYDLGGTSHNPLLTALL